MGRDRFGGWGWAGGLAMVVVLAGCGGGGGSSASRSAPLPAGADAHDATLLAGRTIFAQQCASCHGVRGEGALGPAFIGGRLVRDFPNPRDQVAFVSAGRGVMPAFSGILSRAQIESVVAYERTVLDPRPMTRTAGVGRARAGCGTRRLRRCGSGRAGTAPDDGPRRAAGGSRARGAGRAR